MFDLCSCLFMVIYCIHIEVLQDPMVYSETLQEQTAAEIEDVLVENQQLLLVLI